MSLNWSIVGIDNFDELKTFGLFDENGSFTPAPDGEQYQLKPEVECLIWLSMTCGYSEITEKNWEEVYQRVAIIETIIGGYRHTFDRHMVYFKPEEIRRCIGLKTNSTLMTTAQFNKQSATMLRRPVEATLRQYKEKLLNDQTETAVETEAS